MDSALSKKTASETLFEEYLRAHGYVDLEYEPKLGGAKNPDYSIQFNGRRHLFEVKEFEVSLPRHGPGVFQPYRPIREKVNQAVRQFREYKNFSCSIVLSNPHSSFVLLDDAFILFGAMLGDFGFRVPLGPVTGAENDCETVFTTGGKMVNEKRQEPQNTTISSLIVLGSYPLRTNQCRLAVHNRRKELGRELTTVEWSETYFSTKQAETNPLRLSVYENPYARIPLPRDLFNGPFDERWGNDSEFIKKIWTGSQILDFIDLEK